MLNVSFRDNREALKELLRRKVQAATEAAAAVLSEEYQLILSEDAPPHSQPGQIPHAYLGHKVGGFGPVNKFLGPNNTPDQGFSGTQSRNLKDFIDSARARSGAVVGFAPSHVTSREQNYLLGWDQGTIPGTSVRRPWVDEGYQSGKEEMKTQAASAFRETQ